ncbi:MAG: nucleotidyltransferase family protein [Gammaproteobacteria bacterium]|nr:nucleotidyltransferase family protein [Gammaproteobacteria bacterium]
MLNTEATLWKALAQAITGQATSLEEFDDDEILKQAGLHGVDILLYTQVHAGTVTGLSETLKKNLKSRVYTQVVHDMALNDATQKLLDLLATNQIPALMLKGTPVAFLYYPDTYLRSRCDTDIYIDEYDLKRTAELLSAHNYELSGLGTRKHSSKQFVAAIESVQKQFLHFDMHWMLSNRVLFRSTLPFKECLQSSQPVAGLGSNAHALSITDLMIHACIHRIAHGRNTERNRLIWLYDIHLMAEAMGDTGLDLFLVKAKQKSITVLCADALKTCQAIFNTSLPEHFLADLKTDSKREPSAQLIKASKLRWAWEDLRTLPGVSEKIAFVRELLFG